jgi:uncharacterized phage protein gp47/JayE
MTGDKWLLAVKVVAAVDVSALVRKGETKNMSTKTSSMKIALIAMVAALAFAVALRQAMENFVTGSGSIRI